MNWDIVAGKWKQLRGKLKVQWGDFNDNRPDMIAGRRLETAGKIQADCGVTAEQADRQLRRFAKLNKDYRYKSSH